MLPTIPVNRYLKHTNQQSKPRVPIILSHANQFTTSASLKQPTTSNHHKPPTNQPRKTPRKNQLLPMTTYFVISCHYLPVSGLGSSRACCLPETWWPSLKAPSLDSNTDSMGPVHCHGGPIPYHRKLIGQKHERHFTKMRSAIYHESSRNTTEVGMCGLV